MPAFLHYVVGLQPWVILMLLNYNHVKWRNIYVNKFEKVWFRCKKNFFMENVMYYISNEPFQAKVWTVKVGWNWSYMKSETCEWFISRRWNIFLNEILLSKVHFHIILFKKIVDIVFQQLVVHDQTSYFNTYRT